MTVLSTICVLGHAVYHWRHKSAYYFSDVLDIGAHYLSLNLPRIINYNYWQLLFSTVSRHDYGYSISLLTEL